MSEKKQKLNMLAPMFMVISALCFAMMSAAVKYAVEIPFLQKVFFRNIIITAVIIPVIILKKRKNPGSMIFLGEKRFRLRLVLRSVCGFLGVVSYFFAVERLQLGDAAMLQKLLTFFVIIISAVFLGEKIRGYHVPALIFAFTGALLIIKPGFNMQLIPALFALLSAILAAAAYSIISSLKGRVDSLTIILWFSVISTAASLIPLPFVWKSPDFSELVSLFLTGIFAGGGQYFLTLAYSHGPAGEVSIYTYTQVVFSALIGFFLWKEVPDIFSFAGTVLVLGAAAGLYFAGKRKNPD